MEKFAVVTEANEEKRTVKSGELDKRCPVCNSALASDANVPRCPEHGTKPFEKSQK